jgi:hypothetical protein
VFGKFDALKLCNQEKKASDDRRTLFELKQ